MKTNKISKVLLAASLASLVSTAKADYDILFLTRNNTTSATSTNPIFDVNGTTRLSGADGWVARLFDGATALGTGSAVFSTAAPGFVSGGTIEVVDPSITSTTVKTFQLKVWNSNNGSTFSAAQQAGGAVGSVDVTLTLSGFANASGTELHPISFPQANTFSSFSVAAVPEPATMALGLFGAAGLLFRRRK